HFLMHAIVDLSKLFVGSVAFLLYALSFNRSIIFLSYSILSRITVALPLSAGNTRTFALFLRCLSASSSFVLMLGFGGEDRFRMLAAITRASSATSTG